MGEHNDRKTVVDAPLSLPSSLRPLSPFGPYLFLSFSLFFSLPRPVYLRPVYILLNFDSINGRIELWVVFVPSISSEKAIRVDREGREVYRKYDCIFVSIRPRVVKSVNRVLNVQDRRIIWRDIVEFLIIYGSICKENKCVSVILLVRSFLIAYLKCFDQWLIRSIEWIIERKPVVCFSFFLFFFSK